MKYEKFAVSEPVLIQSNALMTCVWASVLDDAL